MKDLKQTKVESPTQPAKKPYSTPQIFVHGKIEEMTLQAVPPIPGPSQAIHL